MIVERLRVDFPQHTVVECSDYDSLSEATDIEVALTPVVDRQHFEKLQRLRWVQAPATGVEELLFPEMVASRVVVTSARGIRALAVAEYVLAVVFALQKRLCEAGRAQRSHTWSADHLERPGNTGIRNCRLGIVGLGAIGSEVARLAHAVGMQVSAVRRHVEAPRSAAVASVFAPERLDEMLSQCDVVVLCAPATPQTRGLIGAAELSTMKPGALFVNVSRGRLVDERALIGALRSRHLGGAALDVFACEPLDPESPLWELDNVILTPHVAGSMPNYWHRLYELFCQNLTRYVTGVPLLNVVDKAAGY